MHSLNPYLLLSPSVYLRRAVLAEQFQTLVESAVSNPTAKVSELKILSDR
ncbi:MAG: hypothetical protein HWQ35_27105 [Nostoc sp. NMS1]|nr:MULTISPECIES: hypothetical protein [unclassified Nostoc]MBN3910076.1 hypothetical protein [Nostoc sp. NMS1]MBN3989172.1 hypothetical protein [Nostoc sp. NMS2]